MSEPETPVDSAPEVQPAAVQRVTIRRAPKLGVFLVVGALLGALVTLVLTSLFPADPEVGFAASYAYFLVYGIPVGVVLGAVIGLLLDRRSARRAREVDAERQSA
ncbi:MAG: hypothetical protein QM675_06730 [Protaetiibacter sp.]